MSKNNIDTTVDDIFSDAFVSDSIQSDIDFNNLDDIVYNSSSSFDISEIADILLDSIDEFVFITDTTTKNIVYINKPLCEALDINSSFVGTCYELLCGRDTPCPDCTCNKITDDSIFIVNHLNSKLHSNFVLRARNLELYNRTYTINVALPKTEPAAVIPFRDLNKLNTNDILAPYLKLYADNVCNPEVQIYKFIEYFGIELSAENCTLFEHIDLSKNISYQNYEIDPTLNMLRTQIWVNEELNVPDDYVLVPKDIVNKAYEDRVYKEYTVDDDLYVAIPLELDLNPVGMVFIKNPNRAYLKTLDPALKTIQRLLTGSIELKKMHMELSNVASTDPLTGLKNRKQMLVDINNLSLNNRIGVIFLNVNSLKEINTEHGTKYGDEILVKTASLLKQLMPENKNIYRIGGDEFVAIHTAIDEAEFCVLSDMLKAFMLSEKGFSVSVGTHWEKSGILIQKAINLSESDMYTEKKTYYRKNHNGGRYRKQNDAILRLMEPDKIKSYIEQNCFKILYQPKFKIQNDVAEIAGAEALVRLVIDGTVIPPDDFIPALESAHYTYLIDYYVFETICKRMRERLDQNEKVLPVSCNFSRHTIIRTDFKETLKSILNKYNIGYDLIPLEVSEHTNTSRYQDLIEVTNNLADEGFNISIDDFGTAHANIYSLADLSVNEVKFDKKLIDNLASENNSKITTILGVLITMCKKLGIKTIAEGVEEKEQSDILKSLGCDEIQGYYYSKPIKEDDYYGKF
ncbi:bifunctional diguanylate cyclase/phosphodiesterase [Succinivibrio dextrinosolvens]|uniref:bifunctional diguanylate cyclase/phosphodiesterase n=1 Tax=Succinivibrio dextrinosolvens TaxID=83771 RepID=UPI00241F79CC|nr:bifunctional diguanylate cyclase/phosphodiesterase [Succinivibrio dextrinosolvens]MBE6422719.1 bifunctional diguanylate cyclase/phosphodiesterase [Succinivibrio dextrinosolvens]